MLQSGHGLVQRHKGVGALLGRQRGLIERDALPVAAALPGLSRSGVVDDDVAHGGGGQGEEVGPVLDLDPGLVDELEVGLVDQAGGPERDLPAPSLELPACGAVKLVVEEGDESIQRPAVALSQGHQQLGGLVARGWQRHGNVGPEMA